MITTNQNIHIPCGFRCYTKMKMKKKLGIKQGTFPFDNGFFSPYSIKNF